MMIGPGHHHLSCFQRLPQSIKHRSGEFREFIEKQNPIMGQRDFAGLVARAPPPTSAAMDAE